MTRGRLLGLVVTVALASAAVYGKTAGFEFLPSWDDGESVLQNPDVRELDPRTVWRTFTRMTSVMYQPLTTLSFAVDHAVWGFDPAPFHVENVLLHGVAAVLAFLLVHALSSSALVGAIAAALFLLHPVNVENVAWVSERKTILSACFFFGAVLAYVRARGRGSPRPWTLAALLGSAAMLAKPAAMVLPLALAAYEHWLRPDPRVRLTLPLVPLSAAACVPTLIAHLDRAIHPQSLSVGTLIGTVYPSMTVIFWKYIRLLVWPIDLSAFHDAELYGWVDLPVIAAVLTWVATSAAVYTRGSRNVRFWFAWFWICMLPTSNLLPLNNYYADRYLYVPALGAFVIAALAARRLRELLLLRGWCHAAAAPVIATVAIAVAAGFAASRRAEVWRDEVSLWEDTVRRSPNHYAPRLNLGYAYDVRGRYEEAERQYAEAVRIYPTPDAIENLVMVRAKRAFDARRKR